jgi:hypothetical protein
MVYVIISDEVIILMLSFIRPFNSIYKALFSPIKDNHAEIV